MDNPIGMLMIAGGAVYLLQQWLRDYQSFAPGKKVEGGLPGASPAPLFLLLFAFAGALALTLIETFGEILLGVADEQSSLPAWSIFALIGAGIIEEVIFRGYLVVSDRGKRVLILSIFGFSILFALAHYQYYLEWPEGAAWYQFTFKTDLKSAWTLGILLINSLWFYYLRFHPRNQHWSLLPCFVAHVTSNLAVFLIKAVQGFIYWGW